MARATREKLVGLRHLNTMGTLHGGILMKWMDEVGADAAHCHSERFCVTARVDSFEFLRPVLANEILFMEAVVNRVWNTSIEVGIRAQVKGPSTGEPRLVASAYYVYVALDENRKPTSVSEYVPRTNEEKRCWKEAGRRRKLRLLEKNRK